MNVRFKLLLLALVFTVPALVQAQDITTLYNSAVQDLKDHYLKKALETFRQVKKIETQNIDEIQIQIEALYQLVGMLTGDPDPTSANAITKYLGEINEKEAKIRALREASRPANMSMDLLGGEFGAPKTPTELFNEGLDLLGRGNVQQARDKFRDSKKAHPGTMEDFESQIKSLEFVIDYYTKTDPNPDLVVKYSGDLSKCLDEAFMFVKTLRKPTTESIAFAKKIAQKLISIIDTGKYKGFDGNERPFIKLPGDVAQLIARNKEKYLQAAGSSGAEALKTMKLDDALKSAESGILLFKQAQEITGFTDDRIKARKELYSQALENLLRAGQKRDDLFNVEYTLALMLLNGWGADKDFDVAAMHVDKALALGAGEYKQKAEELKKQIEASKLMEKGFEKLEASKEIAGLTDKEETEKEELEKEAFKSLQDSSNIMRMYYEVEFELAQMKHDATGTDYAPAEAQGHLKSASILASAREQKQDISALQDEINDRNAKVDAEMEMRKQQKPKEERGLMRVGLIKPLNRTEVMKEMFKAKIQKTPKKSFFALLFGTKKLKAKRSASSSSASSTPLTGQPVTQASSSRSSLSEASRASTSSSSAAQSGEQASSSSSAKPDKRKSKSPFGFGL